MKRDQGALVPLDQEVLVLEGEVVASIRALAARRALRARQHPDHHQPAGEAVGTVFGDEVLAAAILDRLLHHSYTLMVQGESYRLRQKKKAGPLGQSSRREA